RGTATRIRSTRSRMRWRCTTTPPPTGSRRASVAISSRRSMRCNMSTLSRLAELPLERSHHVRWHQLPNIVTELGYFTNAVPADVQVLQAGHQVNRFDLRRHLLVHQRHVELRLEIRDGADPPHEH